MLSQLNQEVLLQSDWSILLLVSTCHLIPSTTANYPVTVEQKLFLLCCMNMYIVFGRCVSVQSYNLAHIPQEDLPESAVEPPSQLTTAQATEEIR